MGRSIIKIHDDRDNKDYYMEWSSVVDAPVTWGLSLEEFKAHYKERYGTEGMRGLQDRLDEVEERGTSDYSASLNEYYAYNRAGENESCIDKEGILERYCRNHLAVSK